MAVSPKKTQTESIVIIGAGPSGLGCAYELTKKAGKRALKIDIVDKNEIVGGLARTVDYKGYKFDVGPHRFFTKNEEIQKLWEDLLGDDFITVPRLTRILYRNKFFHYPIEIKDVLRNLGVIDSAKSMASYFYAKAFLRNLDPKTFEEWITKNFGHKLYSIFFKTYTEKVWGIPCNEIGAEWAAQRIKNLNFAEVIRNAVGSNKKSKAKSLVDKFYYPVEGAGQLYEVMDSIVTKAGHTVTLNADVTKIKHNKNRITAVEYKDGKKTVTKQLDYLFSSMPLTHFVQALDPAPPKKVIEASKELYYRDHITVNLILKTKDIFQDNWIYVHAPEVKMARIANYNSFSDQMSADPNNTAISVEYFVFQDDDIWKMKDEDLVKLAIKEMETVKLLHAEDVVDGFIIRETESYPTYYMGHKEYYDCLKDYVKSFENLELIGRGGMYKYNNQDHAIYSGLLAARNYLANEKQFDVWEINEDAEYLEEKK